MAPDVALSIILPVHNAQSTLAAQVARVLETAPEITCRFEVLIVDDGSTDSTAEIAHDLAVEFPQVRLVRHSLPRGLQAAARTGVAHSRGEIAFVYEGRSTLRASDLPRLWEGESGRRPLREEVIEAQLVDGAASSASTPGAGGWRSRVRAHQDSGRSGPPAAKITPRRRRLASTGRQT